MDEKFKHSEINLNQNFKPSMPLQFGNMAQTLSYHHHNHSNNSNSLIQPSQTNHNISQHMHHQIPQEQHQLLQPTEISSHHLMASTPSTTSSSHSQQNQSQHPQQLHHHLQTHNNHAHTMHQFKHLNQSQHQLHQQLQHHQPLQLSHHHLQQYNMNSDYSSSTYHVYDQISDLMIIKQQRAERKRQLDHRRKVILLSVVSTLLVATIIFLALTSSSSSSQSSTSTARSQSSSSSMIDLMPNEQPAVPNYTPSSGTRTNDQFDGSTRIGMSPHSHQLCGLHGRPIVINYPDGTIQGTGCSCEPGYAGDRCDLFQPQPNPSTNRCQQTNCSGNGQCTPSGRCFCLAGFMGADCEIRIKVPSDPFQDTSMINPPVINPASNDNLLKTPPQSSSDICQASCMNGQCINGKCKCYKGYTGHMCQDRVDLCYGQTCSNSGVCIAATGQCQCKFGFKGDFCEISDDSVWQRLLNCSNHGQFDYVQRKCICDVGFTGQECSGKTNSQDDSTMSASCRNEQPKLDCGPNGVFDCQQRRCLCQDGFSGDRCQLQECSSQCLRNGQCVDGQCICQLGYYGKHCSLNGCPNECSNRGQCVRIEGQILSDATKSMSSQQAVSGSSSSSSSSSNSNSNSNQQAQQQAILSQYEQPQAEWKCQCQYGSTGEDCSMLIERQCDDGLDNDRDGLIDCADSECCGHSVCQNSTLCMKSHDPLEILMRKQPPPPTSSFFMRMQFLIDKSSSQMYSSSKDFNDSRASVIRGRVTYLRQGMIGVRVSVAGQPNLGITVSREGGYFDIMVNGGGAVALEFRREPFANQQRAIRVPWNEIVLIEPVELALDPRESLELASSSLLSQKQATACLAHNYRFMKPRVLATSIRKSPASVSSKSNTQLLSPVSASRNQPTSSRAVVFKESAIAQQTIQLPGNSNHSVSLVYMSSKANEFMSTIQLQLTPSIEVFKIPQELKLIHLKLVIEGNLFEQTFEVQQNLTHTFAWNRRNVYKQKCFGLSLASVEIGYEYYDCKQIVWSGKLQVPMTGHDLSISDIGQQWNLNLHHRYNYRDHILQRGDGHNFYLKQDRPRVLSAVVGDGYQRAPICPYCDGSLAVPSDQRLFKPQALAAGPDGSLYIGDYNMIRRIEWVPSGGGSPSSPSSSSSSMSRGPQTGESFVRTVLELPTNRAPSRYSLALNFADDNKLYMSDIDRHQIYYVRQNPSSDDIATTGNPLNSSMFGNGGSSSWEDQLVPVVGTGLRCQLGDGSSCGDGQPARLARLIEPKALAFDLSGRMYIADGPNIRVVDSTGKIYTLLGDMSTRGGVGGVTSSRFPCTGDAIPMHKFEPKSPQDVAINPLDDSLHFLDEGVVYKLTSDMRVQHVAGRHANCQYSNSDSTSPNKATKFVFAGAQSIAFAPNGDLYVSTGGSDQDSRSNSAPATFSKVWLKPHDDDSVKPFVGFGSSEVAEVAANEHQQHNQGNQRSALEHKFGVISAICVDEQGKLLVADKQQLHIWQVEPDLPQLSASGEYEIASGDEVLVFNRFGHHVSTRELSTSSSGKQPNKYTFGYSVNTSFGQLASIVFASGNRMSIYRDGAQHGVKMIETSFGGQVKLDVSRSGQVHSITILSPQSSKTSFSYHVDGGLLKQSRDQTSGEVFDFVYDEFGRATSIMQTSPRLGQPIECRLSVVPTTNKVPATNWSPMCVALVVAE